MINNLFRRVMRIVSDSIPHSDPQSPPASRYVNSEINIDANVRPPVEADEAMIYYGAIIDAVQEKYGNHCDAYEFEAPGLPLQRVLIPRYSVRCDPDTDRRWGSDRRHLMVFTLYGPILLSFKSDIGSDYTALPQPRDDESRYQQLRSKFTINEFILAAASTQQHQLDKLNSRQITLTDPETTIWNRLLNRKFDFYITFLNLKDPRYTYAMRDFLGQAGLYMHPSAYHLGRVALEDLRDNI